MYYFMVKVLFHDLVKATDRLPKDLVDALWSEIIFHTTVWVVFFVCVDALESGHFVDGSILDFGLKNDSCKLTVYVDRWSKNHCLKKGKEFWSSTNELGVFPCRIETSLDNRYAVLL